MKRRMVFVAVAVVVFSIGMGAWTMASVAAYESAEYTVVEKDGKIEVRDYPDLMLVATDSEMDMQGTDGSFMRLFRYISGANEADQKIAMTTPVFMEGEIGKSKVSMGFVMPKEVAAQGAPEPKGEGVALRKRDGGRFAVIRFSGRLDAKVAKQQEESLREWMKARGLEGAETSEAAGYNAPYIPGPLRRNEILIRLKEQPQETTESTAGDGPVNNGSVNR